MKGVLITLVLVVALTVPLSANAQDWVMDWHSTGVTLFSTWNLSGTSAATLTLNPLPNAPIFHPDGPVYELRYTFEGRQYGGFVAQGRFQEQNPSMTVPAAGTAPITNNTFGEGQFASGNFNLTGNSFTADVFIGTGHSNAHWTATGTLATVASAAEPTILLLGAVGLVSAVVLRRRREP
jgi:MYXO-CTERM domain-containing protein